MSQPHDAEDTNIGIFKLFKCQGCYGILADPQLGIVPDYLHHASSAT